MKKNIIIVGGNAAGPAAAAKAKRTNPDANVILFEASNFISTGTCELPYVLSGSIDDFEKIIHYTPNKFEQEKGVKVYTNSLVTSLNRINKTINVKNILSNDNFEFPYDKLILTTGSIAKKVSDIPLETSNLFTFKSVGDLLAVLRFIKNKNVKKALVIGSGYIGIEVVEALKVLGIEVIFIDKEPNPLPGAEPEIQSLVLESLKKQNVAFYGSQKKYKFRFADNELKSIVIDGWSFDIDLVIQSVGVLPNTLLAESSKLNLGQFGGLRVDTKLKTNDSNIFAAGDCIEILNKINNRYDYMPIATLAHEFGHVAGENAAGGNSFVNPVVKNIAVKIFNDVFVSVGFNLKEAETNKIFAKSVSSVASNLVKVMPQSRNTFGKVIYEKDSKRIIGANFYGGQEVIGYGDLIAAFISNRLKVDELARINYNYTPPNSPFVNLLSILGRKINKENR